MEGWGWGLLAESNKEENVAVFGDILTQNLTGAHNNTSGKLIPHQPIGQTEGMVRNASV